MTPTEQQNAIRNMTDEQFKRFRFLLEHGMEMHEAIAEAISPAAIYHDGPEGNGVPKPLNR